MRASFLLKAVSAGAVSVAIVGSTMLVSGGGPAAAASLPCPTSSGGGVVAIAEAICNGQGAAINGWPGSEAVFYVFGGGHNPASPGPNAGKGACRPGQKCGVDCSGFTRWVYYLAYGGDVLKDPNSGQSATKYQIKLPALVNVPASSAVPGDLVFFGPSVDNPSHVGVYIRPNIMIDSPNANGHPPHQVRVDPIAKGFGNVLGYYRYNPGGSWPTFGLDPQNTRFNSQETTLGLSDVSNLTQKWHSAPLGAFGGSSPMIVGNTLYIGSHDNNVYALDTGSGSIEWSFATGGIVQLSPAVANSIVYAGSDDGNLYAINASNGTGLWHFQTGGVVQSAPIVVGNIVYFGSADGYLYALNATTGVLLWAFLTAGDIQNSPGYSAGVIYIATELGDVYAVDANTGVELWQFSISQTPGDFSTVIYNAPSIANNLLYVGSVSPDGHGVLYAINTSTGVPAWHFDDGSAGGFYSSAAVANGIAYIGANNGNLYAINATSGNELWHYTTGNLVESVPAIANGVVYFGSRDDQLYALNASNGTKLWSVAMGGMINSSPTVLNGKVYVSPDDGQVYAFGL